MDANLPSFLLNLFLQNLEILAHLEHDVFLIQHFFFCFLLIFLALFAGTHFGYLRELSFALTPLLAEAPHAG